MAPQAWANAIRYLEAMAAFGMMVSRYSTTHALISPDRYSRVDEHAYVPEGHRELLERYVRVHEATFLLQF